jgi:ATP-dependent 26S proteasome regulatory subunit
MEHVRRLSVDAIEDDVLPQVAAETDGFSHAQIREAFILAGQLAFQREHEHIDRDNLIEACRLVRGEYQAVGHRVEARTVGFDVSTPSATGP